MRAQGAHAHTLPKGRTVQRRDKRCTASPNRATVMGLNTTADTMEKLKMDKFEKLERRVAGLETDVHSMMFLWLSAIEFIGTSEREAYCESVRNWVRSDSDISPTLDKYIHLALERDSR